MNCTLSAGWLESHLSRYPNTDTLNMTDATLDTPMRDNLNLIWIDLEMTGLDSNSDRIIEIATVITDSNLQTLAEGPVLAIYQKQEIMAGMDDWNQRQHGKTGLIGRVAESSINENDAERQTLEFLQHWVEAGVSPMCGNSICQDRRFLANYMPLLEAFFHYRNLDVSTIKELARRWAPEVFRGLRKKGAHKALDDIHDSIDELKYYRDQLFRL